MKGLLDSVFLLIIGFQSREADDMPERSNDWIRQALRDLESAEAQKRDEFYEWSCFIAQQAAEKAIKAALQKIGVEVWGHSLLELGRELKEQIDTPPEFETSAKYLDRFYIRAIYPNGWASGTPADYITLEDSEHAVSHSDKIIQFCKGFLAEQESSPEEP